MTKTNAKNKILTNRWSRLAFPRGREVRNGQVSQGYLTISATLKLMTTRIIAPNIEIRIIRLLCCYPSMITCHEIVHP